MNLMIAENERRRLFMTMSLWGYIGIMGTMIAILTNVPEKIVRLLYPGNVFAIGKQVEVLAARARLRSNLFWVVGVGTLMAAVVSYVTSN